MIWLHCSDVTIIEIDTEITIFFRKNEQNQYLDFWSKCDSIPIPCHPRGTGDQCRRSQNGLHTTHESDHAECRGVHISVSPITQSAEEFISLTPNIGAKSRS